MAIGQAKTEKGAIKPSYKVAIVAPTCFYYQVPLFWALAAHPRIDLTVYFCSDEGLLGHDVLKAYGAEGSWGSEEELLQGYDSKLMRNHSPFATYLSSLVGLVNLGIWGEIRRERPDAVVIMSWMNPTWWLAVLACLRFRIPFLYMTDANVTAESEKTLLISWVKKIVLGKVLFPLTTGFLCAGTANRQLYRYYGVLDRKLVPFAYSWGYDALAKASENLKSARARVRVELGLPEESFVILYVGRLSEEKRPFDLLQAYESVALPDKSLLIAGDGYLRESLQDYVSEHDLDGVKLFGFQNRESILKFYAVADVLVLPSIQETWVIVVSEALCFGLPAIVSDQVGSGMDLVSHGWNGFKYAGVDVEALASHIKFLAELPMEERLAMGANSYTIIQDWSQRNLAETLDQYLDLVCNQPAGKRK